MDELLVEHVLVAVEQIPPGRVAAYGEVGALVGIGPRMVGRIMREYGSNVAWWRVTNSYGDVAAHLRAAVVEPWAAEGIAWKPNRRGCRIAEYRVDAATWAAAYDRVGAHLPPYHRPGT